MTNEMFRIMSAIDEELLDMNQALDLLSVFSECAEDEIHSYDHNKPITAICLCDRLPRFLSVMEAARWNLQGCYEHMKKHIEKGEELYRSELPDNEEADS